MRILISFFPVILALIIVAGASGGKVLAQGSGTLNQIGQFKATTTPYNAISTNVSGKNLYLPFSAATTSRMYATTFCINNVTPDCITSWPSGSGGTGSGTVSTSTAETLGQVPFWASTSGTPALLSGGSGSFTWDNTLSKLTVTNASTTNLSIGSLSGVLKAVGGLVSGSATTSDLPEGSNQYFTETRARDAISETITGIDYAAGVLSLTSGFNIPLTASTTNWNTFYDTPSNRITDGTGLTWSTNTLNCDTASGSVQGCLTAADWTTFNSKQAAGNYLTALTGDITASGPGSAAATLATVNGNVGSFGSATQTGTFTVNGKGLITAASNTTITPAIGSITGLGTGVATALGVNVDTAGAFVVNGGALGTPSSGTLTNATGLLPSGVNLTKGNFLVGNDAGIAQATSTIFISSTGNVGIGTTNPALQEGGVSGDKVLTVSSVANGNRAGDIELAGLGNSAGIGNAAGRLTFTISGDAIARVAGYRTSTGVDAGQLSFLTAPSGGTLAERMVIDPTGNVGIGTTAPGAKLEVSGGNIAINSTSNPMLEFMHTGTKYASIYRESSTGTLFVRNDQGNPIILDNANVGIGTTTPYAKFSVGGNVVIGAETAGGTLGDLYLPKLGTAAGSFIAVDATGKVIATTTPSSGGGGSTVTSGYNAGAGSAILSGISMVSGDVLMVWYEAHRDRANDCQAVNMNATWKLKQSTYAATTTIGESGSNNGQSGVGCSMNAFYRHAATTTETVNVEITSAQYQQASVMYQLIQ